MGFQGFFDAGGGNLQAPRRQQQGSGGNVGSALGQQMMQMAPKMMAAEALQRQRDAQAQKALTEKEQLEAKQFAMDNAASMLDRIDPVTAELVRAGAINGQPLVNQLGERRGINAGVDIGFMETGQGGVFQGLPADQRKAIVEASRGDMSKVAELAGKIRTGQDEKVLEDDADFLLDTLPSFQTMLDPSTPSYQAAFQAYGSHDGVVAGATKMLLQNIRQGVEEGLVDRRTLEIISGRVATADMTKLETVLQKTSDDIHKTITGRQKRELENEKLKSESTANLAQANQANATAGLRNAQVKTEGTKQVKNMRTGTGTSSKKQTALEKKADKLDDEIFKAEETLIKEKSKDKMSKNPALIQHQQQRVNQLREEQNSINEQLGRETKPVQSQQSSIVDAISAGNSIIQKINERLGAK